MLKYRRRTFFKDKPLPVDFTRDYIIALRAIGRLHKDEPEARKALKLLKRMSSEAFLAGRGDVWIPSPGPTTGHFPVIGDVPHSMVKRAVRKNTIRRQRAWDAVAASTRPFLPLRSPISQVEKSLLPAVVVSVPFVRGRHPALLGKRVPGELKMAKSGSSSIISIRDMSPADWKRQGFQPLKFAAAGALASRAIRVKAHRVVSTADRMTSNRRALRRWALLSVAAHAGLAAITTGLNASERKRRRKESKEKFAFEEGKQYGLRSFLRRHQVGQRLRKGAIPAILGGLVMKGAQAAHTEFGIPPTTVNLDPVQRTTIKGQYAPLTNRQLRSFRNKLEMKLAPHLLLKEEFQPREVMQALRGAMGEIDIELIGRKAVAFPGF